MAAIESTFPDRVFLAKGSECCVCLDAFGAAAEEAAAAKESGQHVAKLLRELDPSVTALRCLDAAQLFYPFSLSFGASHRLARCGHALHRTCALQVRAPCSCVLTNAARAFWRQ
jgi:hypothetical protein